MEISLTGLTLIESSEGLELQIYYDVAHIPSIGYGHKILANESFSDGITQEHAQTILENDIKSVERYINGLNLSLNQNQFDALVDFGFNLGIGSLHTMLSHGLDQVPTQIVRWVNAGGRPYPALVTRRNAELVLWQTPVTS